MSNDDNRPPRINCAVCNKLVEVVGWHRACDSLDFVIWVECHGERDEMRLDQHQLLLADRNKVFDQIGEAFTTPRISAMPAGGSDA